MNETTRAAIHDGARINADPEDAALGGAAATQGVRVAAQSDTSLIGVGGAVAFGGTAGVGAGAEILSLNKTTDAFIGGATVRAEGDVTVRATSSDDLVGVAAAVGAAGTAGVAGSAGVLVVNPTTRAWIGDDTATDSSSLSAGVADVLAGSNVIVDAASDTEMDLIAGSVGIGGTAGVGVAAAVSVVTKTTQAYIGSGAHVTGLGQESTLSGLGRFGDASFQVDTGSANFAGVNAEGRFEGEIELSPPDTSGMESASDETENDTPSGDAITQDRSVDVAMGSVRGVAVTATNKDHVETIGVSVGGGYVGVAVGGTINVNSSHTSAFIASGASVNVDGSAADAGQDVLVAAANDYHQMGIIGSVGVGFVGVTANADIAVSLSDTQAYIDDGARVNARHNVEVRADNHQDVLSFAFAVGGGAVGVSAPISVVVIGSDTRAFIGDDAQSDATGAQVTAGGSVLVQATDETENFTITGAVAVGAVGVGGTVSVVTINKQTEASIGEYASVSALAQGNPVQDLASGEIESGGNFARADAQGVLVQAESSEDLFVLSASAGVGYFAGVAGSVAVQSVASDTTARIGANARINQPTQSSFNPGAPLVVDVSADTIDLGADHGLRAGDRVVYDNGGGASVGGLSDEASYYVKEVNGNKVKLSATEGGAAVNLVNAGSGSQHRLYSPAQADQSVKVVALNDVQAFAFGGGFAGGIAGIAGGINVGVVRNDTTASIDDGAQVNARGSVDVTALANRDIESVAVSGAAGLAAVAGSVSVWSIGDVVNAGYEVEQRDEDGNDAGAQSDNALKSDDETPQVVVNPVSDLVADTFTVSQHGYETGDHVTYSANGGTAIGGLKDGATYTVIRVDDDHFRLAANDFLAENAVSADGVTVDENGSTALALDASVATGTGHSLRGGSLGSSAAHAESQAAGYSEALRLYEGPSSEPSADSVDGNAYQQAQVASGAAQAIDTHDPSGQSGSNLDADGAAAQSGTRATVGDGARILAEDDVNLTAGERIEFTAFAGTASVGAVGAGAGIAILNIGTAVEATIGASTVLAGADSDDRVTVDASLVTDVTARAWGGQGGAVALGAQVVVVRDHSTQLANIGSGARIDRSG
ncbi:MAG: hypothetical protein OEW36_07175, partial [Hylemonella sp.]|nr:hypothetical protein [Hylemonella sp.]